MLSLLASSFEIKPGCSLLNDLVKKVFLTGSSGFVGRAACRQVVRQDFAATGALRKHTEQPADVEPVIVGEITGGTNWGDALNRVDVVVHLAARVHVMHETAADPLKAFRTVNVDGTLNLARQAVTAGVKRFVFISSLKVNGESTKAGYGLTEADPPKPEEAYGQSKHEAEQGLRQIASDTGIEVVIIRPTLVY